MPYLEHGAHRIYYEITGTGRPLILLHHATGCLHDWQGQLDAFHAAGYRTIAYDRRGFGRSDPLERWSTRYHHEDVEDLLALMDALGLEEVGLVGHSDGATIALLAAAQAPERIAVVVAESPHMWYDDTAVEDAFAVFATTVASSERFWRSLRRDHGEHAEQVLERWRSRWLDPIMQSWDERPCLPHIRCPVLVLHGENDFFFPITHSEKIAAAIAHASFHLFPNTGHVPHQETPERYRAVVLPFLEQAYPSSSQDATNA